MLIDTKDLITINDVMIIFDIKTEATIHRWRKQKGLEKHVINIPSDGRPAVRYSLKGVLAWAKESEMPLVNYKDWKLERKKKLLDQ